MYILVKTHKEEWDFESALNNSNLGNLPTPATRTDVKRCARCGHDHYNLPLYDIAKHKHYDRFGICPETGQPILVKTITG